VCRFLLVSLSIDAILGEVTIRQRRKKLEEMTQGSGLSDAYTATLRRLKAQKGNKSILGLKVLMWVLHSKRALRAEELCHALGVEIGSADLDQENVPALRTLLASSLGLVTIEASSSTVRLVHFTLQEHLSADPTLFPSPHSTIAEVCLTYLNLRCIRDLSPTLYSAPSTMPLLEYASYYWGEHARKGMTENVKLLALRLLDKFDEHVSTQLLLLRYNQDRISGPYFHGLGGPTGFTGLHGVAFLGIAEIVAAVLEMKEWDVNAADCMGSTALTWAAGRGQEEVVRVLLEREGVNPDQADTRDGRTPLSWAAECGHKGVVKMLLEREDVNPNTADTFHGQTPLLWADGSGHEGIVKMLLERKDVNPDQADAEYGRTALLWAAESGHDGVVKLLLGREDVNPNTADPEYGRTPLSLAAENGHERIVRILLERGDINPEPTDTQYGRTPLSWAAERGHEGVVEMLLERENVNPNTADTSGRTPLSWAAWRGREGVIKMLLEREGVNPNQADIRYGRTPLSLAAEYGHGGVVRILLEREDVSPNMAGNSVRTPLSWAAWRGHGEVVEMLLKREDVNPDQADTRYGRTPLSLAAECGHVGVVEMLLKREVNPGAAGTSGRTPLSWAAWGGHEGVVGVLLGRGDVNPNTADTKYGRAPLSWAARRGHEGVVKMLLERKDVHIATLDNNSQTPLSLALSKGHDEVVRIIQGWGDANSGVPDSGGQESCPPPAGDRGVVEMQFRGDDPNTGVADLNGEPTLPFADPDEREVVLNFEHSLSEPTDSDFSPTTPPRLPQPPSVGPLGFRYPSGKTDIHPNATQSILSFAADRCFIIASFFCLLAFLLYFLPSSLLDILSFHKCPPSEGLV